MSISTVFRSFLFLAAAILVSALLLSACGDSDSTEDSDARTTDSPGRVTSAEPIQANLDVRLENIDTVDQELPDFVDCDGEDLEANCSAKIECPAPDGSGENLKAVCSWLSSENAVKAITIEPAENEVCTQIYGGPQTAKITGKLGVHDVDAEFARNNGCAIARYDAVTPLWGGIPDSGQSANEATE